MQAEKTRRYLVRGDDSSYHTFFFDPHTGSRSEAPRIRVIRTARHGRGDKLGVYGFALAYQYTGDRVYLETSKRMAKYFLKHLPEDHVAFGTLTPRKR